MDYSKMQELVKDYERRLLDLKTLQGDISNVKSYSFIINNPSRTMLITYADGDNDIITYAQATSSNLFPRMHLSIVNNAEQKLFLTDYQSSVITLLSTRPIISVEAI